MRTGISASTRNGLAPGNDNHAALDQSPAGGAGRRLAVQPAVTILMCTFNGERFLAEQLASLEWQTFTDWRLIVSDDGSTDGTLAILEAFRSAYPPGRVEIISGPRAGAPANFLFLADRRHPVTDYYAFCDQDDVWETDKLARAVAILEKAPRDLPALYGSRTSLIDAEGRAIGLSPLFPRAPTFRSALVQSIAGGNTMVFNRAARDLLAYCGPDVDIPSHDWWLYQVTSACNGLVYYDPIPSVRYRQHERNIIGSNMGLLAGLRRLRMLAQGRFRRWSDLNVAALARVRPRMSAESRHIFDQFRRARHGPLLQRVAMFAESGVYRQSVPGNIALFAAVVLKKI